MTPTAVFRSLNHRQLRELITVFSKIDDSPYLSELNEAMDVLGRDTKEEAALLSPFSLATDNNGSWYKGNSLIEKGIAPYRGWEPVLWFDQIPNHVRIYLDVEVDRSPELYR